MDKSKQVDKLINSLKKQMNDGIKKQNYEKAMASIQYSCNILYQFNQKYKDDDFEEGVIRISRYYQKYYENTLNHYNPDDNTVLFYDGFGLDKRGVAKNNLNALNKNGYRIIYVGPKTAQGNMPETKKLMEQADISWNYIDTLGSYTNCTKELLSIILKFCPKAMLFYTLPYDASGAVAFATMTGKTDRFLIDLTDHAFWLGVKCNDYFLGSRQISASNQLYERGIRKEQILKCGNSVLIDKSEYNHSDLPFDVKAHRYVFSGGQLYKTLGDPHLYYYQIVRYILKKHTDIYFLYAGGGDTSEMDQIISEYPGRAFLIKERKDYYYLIENCTLYLNTYPMFGGMMMKYCANAGKLPLTLRHGEDSMLLNEQEKCQIDYDTYQELIDDLDNLLDNEAYLHEREKKVKCGVTPEEQFVRDIGSAIEFHTVTLTHSDQRIDTTKFRHEFYERFNFDQAKNESVRLRDKSLFLKYPWMIVAIVKNHFKR